MKCFLTVIKKPLLLKWLLIMKLTAVLTLFFTLNVAANGFGQDKINLRVKNTAIEGVLRSIEKQTNYRFLYNNNLEDIRERVSLNVKDASIAEVLALMLDKTRLLYQEMDNNLIVIKEDPNAPVEVTVRGKVTGEGGLPLAGASVQEKGTTTGTTTNNDGNFSLTVSSANITLVISSIGYEQQEVALSGRTDISVALVTSTKVIDQVVVIGYGSASKRDLTGSIVKVSGKDVADKPNTNPLASLQGRVSGLQVVNTGELGKEPDIRIRGTVSRSQTKPLYIVDGVFNDNIDFINPGDIESIEILKDPSSLAIFGVRGANGVIVVTSKKGKGSGVTVNLTSTVGVKRMVDKIELTDAAGFRTLYNELNPGFDYTKYNANTDWVDLISQNGVFNRNNISISSNTERNRFYMGAGYQYEEGIIKYEKLQKFSLVLNDELKISKAFKIGFNVNAYRGKNPALQTFGNALAATPIVDPYNEAAGLYNQLPIGTAQIANPLRVIEEGRDNNISNTNRVVGNIYFEAGLFKGLTFKATYYTDLGFTDSRGYNPLVKTFNLGTNSVSVENSVTSITNVKAKNSKYQQDYTLTYQNRFGDHGLTVLGGFSTIYTAYEETNVRGRQFTTGLALPIPDDERFWYVDNRVFVDPTSVTVVEPLKDAFQNFLPYQWDQATVSFLGRVLYNYKQKYLLNASFRRDGSSDIKTENKYQNFVAVGAAWEISKEDFMQSQKTFDFLKFKVSGGVLGNQYTSIHYPFYPILASTSTAVFGPNGGTPIAGYSPSFLVAPDLKWETITSYEAGIEFGLLNNRLTGDLNYYNKLTKNLLTNYPGGAGTKPGITNAGEIANKGIELALTWSDNIGSDWRYNISGNLTTLDNEVKELFNNAPIFDAPTRTIVGDPIGSFYGYVVEGVYQDAADIANSPTSTISTRNPGDLKYKDINGDKTLTDLDRVTIGNPTPKFIYGFSAGVNYKGFDFGFDLQGVQGNEIFRDWGNGAGYATLNFRTARLNRWHGAGTSNFEPIVKDVGLAASTYMIEDGSYLRIRNVQLGYNFSTNMLRSVHIKSLRVFISGQNLKTFKDNSGFTPEFGGTATKFGVDAGSYPVPAIYSFGINANF
jgi:TonB-linked SusC/RagA family outer membrane protein